MSYDKKSWLEFPPIKNKNTWVDLAGRTMDDHCIEIRREK